MTLKTSLLKLNSWLDDWFPLWVIPLVLVNYYVVYTVRPELIPIFNLALLFMAILFVLLTIVFAPLTILIVLVGTACWVSDKIHGRKNEV